MTTMNYASLLIHGFSLIEILDTLNQEQMLHIIQKSIIQQILKQYKVNTVLRIYIQLNTRTQIIRVSSKSLQGFKQKLT